MYQGQQECMQLMQLSPKTLLRGLASLTVWCKPAVIDARLTNELPSLSAATNSLVVQGSCCHLHILCALCPHGLSTLWLRWALYTAPCSRSGALWCRSMIVRQT